jgi:hypothetical protein
VTPDPWQRWVIDAQQERRVATVIGARLTPSRPIRDPKPMGEGR